VDSKPIIVDHAFEDIAQRYVEIALRADEILGRGSLVDSLFAKDLTAPSIGLPSIGAAIADIIHALEVHSIGSNRNRAIDMIANLKAIAVLLRLSTHRHADESYVDILGELAGGRTLDIRQSHEIHPHRQSELLSLLSSIGYTSAWPTCAMAWNEDNTVDATEYLAEMKNASNALKDVTFDIIVNKVLGEDSSRYLQSHSSVEFELVAGADWAANHVYHGNYRSTIQVNSGRRFNRHEAFVFASHEVYPGHHISAILREWLSSEGQLGIESTLTLLTLPSAIANEGVAECSRDLLPLALTADQRIAILFDQYITDTRHEFAHLVNTGQLSQNDAVIQFSRSCGLPLERATQMMNFGVRWRYYAPAYSIGRRLVSAYLDKQAALESEIDLKALFTASTLDSILT